VSEAAAESLILAVGQPRVDQALPEEEKVAVAIAMLGQAAERGARLFLLPEGFPGPLRDSSDFEAAPRMAEAAARHGCAVCWSRLERGGDDGWRLVVYIHDRFGREALRYERAHPATGDVHPTLSGVRLAPGAELGLADVDGVSVGVIVCSELWLPEVARVLAIRGAEVLLAPAGGALRRVAANWRLLAQARAIENECHLAMTQHLFGDEPGSALIAGPESVLTRGEDAGVFISECDLGRARWLRSIDDSMEEPKPFASVPGLLRARRPGLYGDLAAPAPDLYDYEGAAGAPAGS
jgi:predicted amidohydrolase